MALDGVSIDVKAGELSVLLGANGAGKSTLLKALAGQIKPTSGELLLQGKPISEYARQEVARAIAYVSQFESFESDLSVREIVRLGRIPHRGWWRPLSTHDENIVDTAIDAMCLNEVKDRRAKSLSGGQWRRMILARAMAQQALILVLDEPIAGLDLKYQIESLKLLQYFCRQQQTTVILSLHELNLASLFADQVVLMLAGRVLAQGDATQVLSTANLQSAFAIDVRLTEHPTRKVPMIIPDL